MLLQSPFFALLSVLLLTVSPTGAAEMPVEFTPWHARGWKGQGIKVALLDNGFRGYRTQLSKALPRTLIVKSFRNDGELEARDSTHGLHCAEIVHAIAPDATLLLANWEPDDTTSFLRAVSWARAEGAAIISCSIVMPGWSDGRGNGVVHRELAKRVEGCLFFASTCNLAERQWNGMFTGKGEQLHQWRPERVENRVLPWGDRPISVELTARDASTYRLTVRDEMGEEAAREQPLPAPGMRGSMVRWLPVPGKKYHARVELVSGSGGEIRLVALGGELEYVTPGPSLVFPGDGREVIAVGALDVSGRKLDISATGWKGQQVKPECSALVPWPSRMRATPFGGTSAAAPQAAGVAALLWCRDPKALSATIRERLLKSCRDVGVAGPDSETGYGRISLGTP